MESRLPKIKVRMPIEEVHQKTTSNLDSNSKYKQYDHTQLEEAYVAVKEGNIGVTKAAKMYEVPAQTLRDRVQGKISIDTITTGRTPILSLEEEKKIVDHLQYVVNLGYGYTRQEVVDIATDYAIHLGKRTKQTPLTINWFCKFIARWPELKVLKSRSYKVFPAIPTAGAVVYYFQELDRIMTKYDLQDKPHLIFNVDEKMVTQDKTFPFFVADTNYHPQAVTSEKGNTTTIICSGSASGIAIPPFFVFAGKRLMTELTKGSSPGVAGVMSETGWSNVEIFRQYLQEHFIKFVPQRNPGQHLLLILDGDTSHISVDLIDWAKTQNIILFVLPAHSSDVLQPLDAGCYGPFQRIFNTECHTVTSQLAIAITRYDICCLSCKAYSNALSQENLHAAFRKCGIFPLDKNVINISKATTMPADIVVTPDDLGTTQTTSSESDTIFPSRIKIKTIIQANKTRGKTKTRRHIIVRNSRCSIGPGHFSKAKRILRASARN